MITSLKELAELINNSEVYPEVEVEEAIEANGWIYTSSLSDKDVCSDRHEYIILDEDGTATVLSELSRYDDEDAREFFEIVMQERQGKLLEWELEHFGEEDYEEQREQYKKFLCI